ncbi:hypothetical protein PF008_g20185 [Phytophthora fragariae]|uniref:Alcohol dehydrogenase-like C-terminal domain-containing protein n=1 Tax=Phytophthora fragariae TaxID=53985 RepID=A0A6G0R084_9STRA|nr:hypothetical protein PF008_g20185 [Phytophthora fragariae]
MPFGTVGSVMWLSMSESVLPVEVVKATAPGGTVLCNVCPSMSCLDPSRCSLWTQSAACGHTSRQQVHTGIC